MFVSYAQNFEDVILSRALKGVEKGFYIDIGANDPDVQSVSKAFHGCGWSGISVEPEARFAELLRQRRPGETIVEAAVGPATETTAFYSIDGTGLSTLDLEIAKAHAPNYQFVTRLVRAVTLDHLLDMAEDEVHWLKIDVEGFEQGVISSWHTSKKRPWIVVVESVSSVTSQRNVGSWGTHLARKGYSFAYFDGLNDFYVHQDHVDLMERFGAPPNVFDQFVFAEDSSFCHLANMRWQSEAARLKHVIDEQTAQVTAAEAERQVSNAEIANARARLATREAELGQTIDQQQGELARLQHVIDEQPKWRRAAIARHGLLAAELHSIRSSTSWRINAPLRAAVISFRQVTTRARHLPAIVARRAANLVRERFPRLSQRIKARPWVRRAIFAVMALPVASKGRAVASSNLRLSPPSVRVGLAQEGVGATTESLLLDRMRPWIFGARWNA